ncbi:MAG: right-handed parallel beta-helix repeat-containing protein, partial [Lewinella sp.]
PGSKLVTADGTSKVCKEGLLFNSAPTSTNAVIIVTSINDNTGSGTLRSAIRTANLTPGPDEIVFNITTGTAPFVIALSSQLPNITEDLTITGNSNVRINTNGNNAFSIQGANNITLKDLDLSVTPGSNSLAINIFPLAGTIRSSNIAITNNNLSGYGRAINAQAADGLTITGNDFSNNGTDEFDAAILVDDVTLFTASNNNFQNAAAGFLLRNMDGVHFDSDASANPDVLLVAGDNFSTVTHPIIVSTSDNITIKNLDLSGATGGNAIYLPGTGGSPHSNIIIDNNAFSGHISGVSVVLADGVTITNNDFRGTSDPVTGTSALSLHEITNLEAYGNNFTDVGDAVSLFNMDGLKVDNVQGVGTHLVLEDDSGIASALQALTIQNMTNTTVQNITFSSQGPRAIYINSGDNNTFTGLHFNNSIIGIDMTNGADDNTIDCSTFTNIGGSGTGTAAVQALNSTGLIMTNNTFGCLNGAKAIIALGSFIRAENNYFGSSGDPDASDFQGNVDFEPFLSSPASCAPDGEAACPTELGCTITGIAVNDGVVGTLIGSVVETASVTKEFIVSNGGSAPLTVSDITSNESKFTIEGFTNSTVLAPGAMATFTVRFTPGAGTTGNASAVISLDSDDCNLNPYVINVAAESLVARAYNPDSDRYYATLMDAIDDIEDNGAEQETLIITAGTYMEGLDLTNKNLKVTFGPLPEPGS